MVLLLTIIFILMNKKFSWPFFTLQGEKSSKFVEKKSFFVEHSPYAEGMKPGEKQQIHQWNGNGANHAGLIFFERVAINDDEDAADRRVDARVCADELLCVHFAAGHRVQESKIWKPGW